MRKDSIDITGARENLEKVKDFAWNIGKFGSTWSDRKWLYIAITADTDRDSIIKLIDYAQENSCYTNVATANFIKYKKYEDAAEKIWSYENKATYDEKKKATDELFYKFWNEVLS